VWNVPGTGQKFVIWQVSNKLVLRYSALIRTVGFTPLSRRLHRKNGTQMRVLCHRQGTKPGIYDQETVRSEICVLTGYHLFLRQHTRDKEIGNENWSIDQKQKTRTIHYKVFFMLEKLMFWWFASDLLATHGAIQTCFDWLIDWSSNQFSG